VLRLGLPAHVNRIKRGRANLEQFILSTGGKDRFYPSPVSTSFKNSYSCMVAYARYMCGTGTFP
jgi:hypothetical protein